MKLLADSAANGRTDEPPWIYYLVQEDLAAHQGICHTGLGEANPAIEIFDRALPALPAERIRDRAYYLSWAVKAHVDNHGPEQATALARETAHITIDTGSGVVLKKLHGEYEKLHKTHKDVRAVQELGDLLRSPERNPLLPPERRTRSARSANVDGLTPFSSLVH
jgi:hypothetical protein